MLHKGKKHFSHRQDELCRIFMAHAYSATPHLQWPTVNGQTKFAGAREKQWTMDN